MSVIAYVDGASRGQGANKVGDGAVGVVIYRNGKLVGQYARGLGKRNNNECEYEAVLTALLLCWAAPNLADPIIYSDSALVVKQVNREWSCNNPALVPLLMSIREIQEVFRFRIQQVPRKVVYEADLLANMFLDKLLREAGY